MATLEAELFLLGHWKNFEEMEENLSLLELEVILSAAREQEYSRQKFAAALKGVDLDENKSKNSSSFEDVKRRAEAKARGVSEEQISFGEIGIAIIEE